MSTYDYPAVATKVITALVKYGFTVTLPRTTGGSIDPIDGYTIAGSDASVTTTGLLKSYKDSMIDGTRILNGDRELLLSNEQEPLPSDKPTIGGESWTIVNIETVKPDDNTVIAYRCQVRK